MTYAGRTNVFEVDLQVPPVGRDYEVLRIQVLASDAPAVNFGRHERTFKLIP